jgi:hypothetical protein
VCQEAGPALGGAHDGCPAGLGAHPVAMNHIIFYLFFLGISRTTFYTLFAEFRIKNETAFIDLDRLFFCFFKI